MADWRPIRRERIEVLDIDAGGLVNARVHLSEDAPAKWLDILKVEIGTSISAFNAPLVEASSLLIRYPAPELNQYANHIDRLIEQANKRYEQIVIPQEQELQRVAEQAAADKARRLEEARQEAERLNSGDQ